jgi:hypothetical protein
LPAAAAPRTELDDDAEGLGGGEALGGLGGALASGAARAVFSEAPHGTRRNRLRGRSPPNQLATEGPTKSARTRATPTPSAIRNHRTLKMLGWRRIRCDTSDFTRLMLEFPKYDTMLAGQC